jgi:uncharacterized protein YukJ
MTKLFLDDFRSPTDVFKSTIDFDYENNNDWLVVKSHDEFINFILNNDLPELISFDHDLDFNHYLQEHQMEIDYNVIQKTGYHALKWLIAFCEQIKLDLPKCKVHSQNVTGKKNMLDLIEISRKK